MTHQSHILHTMAYCLQLLVITKKDGLWGEYFLFYSFSKQCYCRVIHFRQFANIKLSLWRPVILFCLQNLNYFKWYIQLPEKSGLLPMCLFTAVTYNAVNYRPVRKKYDSSKLNIFINKKFKKWFYFSICILPDYLPHESQKEFWKNSHF